MWRSGFASGVATRSAAIPPSSRRSVSVPAGGIGARRAKRAVRSRSRAIVTRGLLPGFTSRRKPSRKSSARTLIAASR